MIFVDGQGRSTFRETFTFGCLNFNRDVIKSFCLSPTVEDARVEGTTSIRQREAYSGSVSVYYFTHGIVHVRSRR